MGNLILLNTFNLKLEKKIKEKSKRELIGPFRVIERIGKQSYN